MPVSAAEVPEETVQETTAVVETTEPKETIPETQPTEPEETIPETQPTEPEETVPETQPTEPEETIPETQPTEPEETIPETQPTEPEETVPETQPTEPEETVPETQPTEPEETTPETEPEETMILTIEEAWQAESNTDVTVCATLVYLSGTNGVLQDSTGGIRVTFFEAPGLELGTVVLATGKRSGGIQISSFAVVEAGEMPAVETTLLSAPENLRVRIPNAKVNRFSIVQDSFTMSLFEELPSNIPAGSRADVYGVILDGIFYADRFEPRAAVEEEPEITENWNLYFGLLHAHTELSDGEGTVTEAFSHAAQIEGLDFFAVTDHSNSFDNANEGDIRIDGTKISQEWAQGKAAAEAVTDEEFVGIFGYEMTWPEDAALGHINTFNTPGWQTRDQAGCDSLEGYYSRLAQISGAVSMFNHPGNFFGEFMGFRNYSAEYDAVMHLLELGGDDPETACRSYIKALDNGWHLAPTNSQNNHYGSWGDASPVRTVVLAEELTEQSLYEAMGNYRVYATEDSDLTIQYRLNGHIMGSILGPEEKITVTASLEDISDGVVGTVEVIGSGGEVLQSSVVNEPSRDLTIEVSNNSSSYYFLRIVQPDGDIAVTAPVWIEKYENLGVHSFSADREDPVQGEQVMVSLELYNEEAVGFRVEKLEFFLGDTLIEEVSDYGTVDILERSTYSFPFTRPEAGQVELLAKVTGTVAGQTRTWREPLMIRFQSRDTAVEASIAQARTGEPGKTYRVRGYVTTGNDSPYTSFPGMFYLQDDTGGIAVEGTVEEYLGIGTHMELTGILLAEEGNRLLKLTKYELTEEYPWRYEGEAVTGEKALDLTANGGKLLTAEGKVVSVVPTVDKKGLSRFTLRTSWGGLVTVSVEEDIRSGAHGVNTLASTVRKGRTVRAMGLLHMDENGKTVLRVRNCDEVVYVPAKADVSNPRTGDALAELIAAIQQWLPWNWRLF